MEIESTFEEAKLNSTPRTMDHEKESHHQERDSSAPKIAEIESRTAGSNNFGAAELTVNKTKRFCFLAANVVLLLISNSGTPLLVRIYFLHGGSRKWFSAFLQTAGFPILILPPLFSFLRRRGLRRGAPGARKFFSLRRRLFLFSIVIGIITGIDDFLYSYGSSYVPVSISAILLATQLGFTALFAFLIVRHKFTASSINAVVILTFASVVLGIDTNGHDRPAGESTAQFFTGFMMLLAAAALYALALPLMELSYAIAKQKVTVMVLIEVQLTIGLAATAVCAVGMAAHNDFQAISNEAEAYGLGKANYYLVIVSTAALSQVFFVALVCTIKYSSALLAGIVIAASIPLTEVLAVFFFHEKFNGQKGVALALALWGSASYFYGEYKVYQRSKAITIESRLPVSVPLIAESEMR